MKNLFFPLFIFALAMSSCAKDDVTDGGDYTVNTGDLVAINAFAGTATKGADMTTDLLEKNGFVLLHVDDASDNNGITSEFAYSGSDWAQTAATKLKWSSITFPANFYSLHDGDDGDDSTPLKADALSVNFEDGYATYNDYTVTGSSVGHKDLVYHASILNAIPTGNTLSALHKHALSKLHLYAATGNYKAYISNARLVSIDGKGNVKITPLTADNTTDMGVEWTTTGLPVDLEDYLYYDMDDYSLSTPNLFMTSAGVNPIINDDTKAPMMIIPQTTSAATISPDPTDNEAIIGSGSYVEVIFYLTDANDKPIFGSPTVSALPNGGDYIAEDQNKALYVMTGFPLGHTFNPNKEYDITLGLGSNSSSGGVLLKDYYVDKDGNAVELTKCVDKNPKPEIDIPGGEDGKDLFGEFDITVDVSGWDDGTDHTIN